MTTRPCTVGLTGGLASGKSSVAERFERLGAEVFDCDAYVHELYRPGRPGALDVAYLFGTGVLDDTGGVDRNALAALVLDDADRRARLEGAIHPLVRAGVDDWLETLGPRSIAVVEAALLVEAGSWRRYDLLAVVWCEPEQQIERAIGRGVSDARAHALIAAQAPLADKRRHADVVIDNSGAIERLDAEVARAWKEILDRCRGR